MNDTSALVDEIFGVDSENSSIDLVWQQLSVSQRSSEAESQSQSQSQSQSEEAAHIYSTEDMRNDGGKERCECCKCLSKSVSTVPNTK